MFARGTFNFTDDDPGLRRAVVLPGQDRRRAIRPPCTRATWYDPSTTTHQLVAEHLPAGRPPRQPVQRQQPGRAALLRRRRRSAARDADYETGTQRYLAGRQGHDCGWDWDVAGAVHPTASTDDHSTKLLSATTGCCRASPAPARTATTASARSAEPQQPGDLRLDRARPRHDDRRPRTRSSTPRRRATSTSSTAASWRWRVGYEFRREELDNPGTPGHRHGQRPRPRLLGGVRLAQRQRAVRRAVRAGPQEPRADRRRPLRRLLRRRQHVEPEDRRQVDGDAAARAARHLRHGVPRAGPVRDRATRTLGRLHGRRRSRFAARSPASPADCTAPVLADQHRQPVHQAGDVRHLDRRRDLGADAGPDGTLDYWNIKTKNQITIGSVQAVLNNPAAFPDATIGRDTNNLPGHSRIRARALRVRRRTRTPTRSRPTVSTSTSSGGRACKDWGTLTTEFQWTHVFNYSRRSPTAEFKYAGTQGNYDVSSGSRHAGGPHEPDPRLAARPVERDGHRPLRQRLRRDPVPGRGRRRDECLSLLDGRGRATSSSFTTLDLSASYSGFKNWQIFGSVINVFNRIAPFNPAAAYGIVNYNYNYAFSGATGTQFNLGVRYTFQ